MVKQRMIETNEGIQQEFDVVGYDIFQRRMRDRGWIETDAIIRCGIHCGHVLEVGPGPGYLGLEWLKKTENSDLNCIEISANMIRVAQKNASEYRLNDRVSYQFGNAEQIPFESESFDAVFTNGSLHEWEHPVMIMNEIYRVLKPGGRYFISDLRRDVSLPIRYFLFATVKPKAMRSGLKSSLGAAYTAEEIQGILKTSDLKEAAVACDPFGLSITGVKAV